MSDFLLRNVTLITLLIATAVGLAVALLCWLLTRSVSDVPLEDREYKDPPPLGFRMSWWLLQWIGHYGQAVPWNHCRRQHQHDYRHQSHADGVY